MLHGHKSWPSSWRVSPTSWKEKRSCSSKQSDVSRCSIICLIVLWFCFILKLALSFTMLYSTRTVKCLPSKEKGVNTLVKKGKNSMGKMRSIRAYGLSKLLDLQIAKCSESASGREQSLSALLHLQHVWPRCPRCTCFKCNTFFKSMALDFLDFETNQSLFN